MGMPFTTRGVSKQSHKAIITEDKKINTQANPVRKLKILILFLHPLFNT